MEPTALIIFFLGFARKLFDELGYKKSDGYTQMLTMALVFTISIAQTMTPFSHFLVIYGLDFYHQATGETISMITYMKYVIPIGILTFIAMLIILRLFFKPDMSKIESFDLTKVLAKSKPMDLREKITVGVFFATVLMWVLPEILAVIAPNFALGTMLGKHGITLWAMLAIALLAVLHVDGKPVLELKIAFKEGVDFNVLFLATACILMGSVVTDDKVGLGQLILNVVEPITGGLPIFLQMLFLIGLTVLLTNLTSNLTALMLMLGVGLTLAAETTGLSGVAITLGVTYVAGSAFMLPASSHLIGMLYGNEYSKGGLIFKYGSMLAVSSVLIATLGYPLSSILM